MDDLRVGSLCTGYGGLDQAVSDHFGASLAWWSDIEPGPQAVMSRHTDTPNLGDLKEIDWSSVPPINILTAGYPCQPFSNAGKRAGTDDPRHIWPWITQGIGILRPRYIVLENVAAHLRRGFDIVTADLADLGYDTRWCVVRASDAGAPHQRRRLFVVATDSTREGPQGARPSGPETRWRRRPEYTDIEATTDPSSSERLSEVAAFWGPYAPAIHRWERVTGRLAPDPTETGRRGSTVLSPQFVEWMMGLPPGHVTDTPGLSRAQQLRLLGNGVVPQQAAVALSLLQHS